MHIIAIDIGTSRIKCALIDAEGKMQQLRSKRLARAESPNVQDANVWVQSAAELLRDVVSVAEGIVIDAIALTGNMHTLLPVDKSGSPLAPAVLWCDNSSLAESEVLNQQYGSFLLEHFGNVSTPVFTLPKLLKLKNERPELYKQAYQFLQSKDIIAHFLTGQFATDASDASGTLLMELSTHRWASDFIQELQLDESKLPEILPSSTICGTVTAAAASLTGLKQGIPVIIGCGDLASAALGSAVDDHTMSLTLGTAGQFLATGKPGMGKKLAGKLFIFAHADDTRELYLGSVPAGGFSFEWLAKLHRLSMEEFFAEAERMQDHCDLPIFLPYILGRGAPYMDYRPNGTWVGLSASHGIPHICRAAILGVLSALKQSCDLLEEHNGRRERIVLQALASREKSVRDCACALFSQQKYISENGEASLYGAAMLGMLAVGQYSTLDEAMEKLWRGISCKNSVISGTEQYYSRYLAIATALGEDMGNDDGGRYK